MCLVLRFDDGSLLTENVAILSMVADRVCELVPQAPTGRYRPWEMLAFISTEIHKSFKPLFSSDASTEEKKTAANLIGEKLQLIASEFQGPYIVGDALSAADPYLFVMLTWTEKNGITIPASMKRFMQTMTSRKSTQTALKDEGLA